jgi:hypothetical protein
MLPKAFRGKRPQMPGSLVVLGMTDTNIEITLLGFFLDLSQLRRLLAAISRGDHIWSCPQTVSEDADWITISYSNPIYGTTLPNQIVYRFPLFHDGTSCFPVDERTYVCLSPDVAEDIQVGLYIEEDGVKEDFCEDLGVFFDPIRAELLSRYRTWAGQVSSSREKDGGAQ